MRFIKTKTSDGVHFVGLISQPSPKTDKAIMHIHGMGGSPIENSWYQDFHDKFPENGYAFLAGQNRGTGSITIFQQDPDKYPSYGNTFEIFEDSVKDIDAWLNCVRQLGYKQIILQAHSFGPSKVVYYLNQRPAEDIIAINLISPVDMLGLTKALNDHEAMLAESQKLVEQGKERQLLSNLLDGESYISAQTYLNLFGPDSNANVFCYTNREHDWSLVNNIKVPVLLTGGTKDFGIEEIAKTENAFEKLKKEFKSSPSVKTKIYKGAEHDFKGYEDQIIKDLIEFIK